jgi:acetyl-CoA carboxylase biotin carboxyl carrier protein
VAEEIRAGMVADVLVVSVAEGGSVDDGDSPVLPESTKIPVLSEMSGTVSAIAVKPGDVVQEGDLIAVVG